MKEVKCLYCGKSFIPAIDTRTGNKSEYIKKPDCRCLNNNRLKVSVG